MPNVDRFLFSVSSASLLLSLVFLNRMWTLKCGARFQWTISALIAFEICTDEKPIGKSNKMHTCSFEKKKVVHIRYNSSSLSASHTKINRQITVLRSVFNGKLSQLPNPNAWVEFDDWGLRTSEPRAVREREKESWQRVKWNRLFLAGLLGDFLRSTLSFSLSHIRMPRTMRNNVNPISPPNTTTMTTTTVPYS